MLTAGAPFHAMMLHVATKPPQALAEVANSGHDYSDAGEPTAMAATTARANAKWFSTSLTDLVITETEQAPNSILTLQIESLDRGSSRWIEDRVLVDRVCQIWSHAQL